MYFCHQIQRNDARPWKQDEINKIQELFNSGWREKRKEKYITDESPIEE